MELEKKQKERDEDEAYKNMTPEQRLAEKLRLQKLQEENDLKLALGTLGIVDKSTIDGMDPKTKEEFSELADAISKKVVEYRFDDEFSGFAEKLISNICASCE
jgi:translation initiation factor 3 subunit J